jgi:RNA polymerase sigma-70 factor (ECF subfamily)
MEDAGHSDPEELRIVIAQYRDDAYRVARRLTRSPHEAEDLAQTALLNVLRRAEFIVDETKVRSYLLTAVRNVWRNQLRSRSKRHVVGSDAAELIPADELEPEEQVMTLLEARLAATAFASLSTTSREVIRLRYIEGLDYHELSGSLGITAVAARQRAHRAREELISACMELDGQTDAEDCQFVRVRLGRFHRGLLTRKARSRVALHLHACRQCTTHYEQVVDLYGHRLGKSAKEDERD